MWSPIQQPLPFTLTATRHLRKMRGGSQAQLLLASDGRQYVTKFQGNPQHTRILANELIFTRMAHWFGLPVPRCEIIEVPESFIEETPELRITDSAGVRPYRPGLQFGSLYLADETEGMAFDYLPSHMLANVINSQDFARILVLDKWASNADGRQ